MSIKIDQSLSFLEQERAIWLDIMKDNQGWLGVSNNMLMTYTLLEDDGEVEFTAGFAIEELLSCVGRIQDLVSAAKYFWPNNSDKFQKIGTRNALRQLIPDLGFKLSNSNNIGLVCEVLKYGIKPLTEIDLNQPEENTVYIYENFCALRRLVARMNSINCPPMVQSFLKVQAITNKWLYDWHERIQEQFNQLPIEYQLRLRRSFRFYLASEYLYPWVSYNKDSTLDKYYKTLFSLAGLGRTHENYEGVMTSLSTYEVMDDDFNEFLRPIINRISEALNQIGRYEELLEKIQDGGGQLGDGSMLGSSNINVLPSNEERTECQSILVAFAQGKRHPSGLKSIMKEVRRHLIRCGDSACNVSKPTKYVIIFTDTWDPDIIAESSSDFKAHSENTFMPKRFVGVLVNGTQLTVQKII